MRTHVREPLRLRPLVVFNAMSNLPRRRARPELLDVKRTSMTKLHPGTETTGLAGRGQRHCRRRRAGASRSARRAITSDRTAILSLMQWHPVHRHHRVAAVALTSRRSPVVNVFAPAACNPHKSEKCVTFFLFQRKSFSTWFWRSTRRKRSVYIPVSAEIRRSTAPMLDYFQTMSLLLHTHITI